MLTGADFPLNVQGGHPQFFLFASCQCMKCILGRLMMDVAFKSQCKARLLKALQILPPPPVELVAQRESVFVNGLRANYRWN